MTKQKEIILNALDEILVDVLNGGNPGPGICYVTWRKTGGHYFEPIFQKHFKTWDHCKNNIRFPIEGYKFIHIKNFDYGTLWKGKNRKLRISLLCHLIREIYVELKREG